MSSLNNKKVAVRKNSIFSVRLRNGKFALIQNEALRLAQNT